MRELAVTDAIPQKNWATREIRIKNSAAWRPMEAIQMTPAALIPAPAAALYWSLPMAHGIAYVKPIIRTRPATIDTQIDVMMPRGTLVAASRVSSVMCADASYPVSVYCANIRPTRVTQIAAPPKPQPRPL